MANLKTLLNTVLAGASGYALYVIPPQEKPYAFAACTLGLCHGLLGMFEGVKGEDCEQVVKMKKTTTSAMEIIPLPLINIELYLTSSSNIIALGHGLFILPLAVDATSKFLGMEQGEEDNAETLWHLTILGNIFSLTYLAVNESNVLYGGMALCAFLTKYGSMLSEANYEGTAEPEVLAGNSILYYLTSEAVAPQA